MGPSLLNWFLYSLVVSLVAGYVAGLALGPGAHYMKVFRFVSTVAFAEIRFGIERAANPAHRAALHD